MSTKRIQYQELESYLEVVIGLLDGMKIEKSHSMLSEYLARKPEELNDKQEKLLVELFFAKCRRDFHGLSQDG